MTRVVLAGSCEDNRDTGRDDLFQGRLMGKWEVRQGCARTGRSDQCELRGQQGKIPGGLEKGATGLLLIHAPTGAPSDAEPSRRVVGLQMTPPEALISSLCFRLDMQYQP